MPAGMRTKALPEESKLVAKPILKQAKPKKPLDDGLGDQILKQ
jgi:hypothetical protein